MSPIPRKPKSATTKAKGTTGLNRFGGMVSEEWLPNLQGTKAVKIYREMSDNDAVIGAFLYAVEMLIRQTKWRIVNDENDLVKNSFKDLDFDTAVSEMLSALIYGWALLEVTYKKSESGQIIWSEWGIRSQETLQEWVFDESGNAIEMIQCAPPYYHRVNIPLNKCIHIRFFKRKANPEGRSILRTAYRSWYMKKNMEEIEGIGIERDLAGLPVMWVPPQILERSTPEANAAYNAYKDIVTNVRRDEQEGIIMPLEFTETGNKVYNLELLTSNSKRQFDTNQIIMRYEQRIAMTVLADFMLLGHDSTGSFALSSSKTSMFATAVGAMLSVISSEINKQIRKLLAINGRQSLTTYFEFLDIETPDLEIVGKYISNLAKAGMQLFPNQDLENTLLEFASLPKNYKGVTAEDAVSNKQRPPETGTEITDTSTDSLAEDV